MEINESNFIKQLAKKNKKALDYVVDNYSNLIFKVTHNVLNSDLHSHYVDESVNDVFWSVWNHIDSFDEQKGNFKHWIAAIAKHKAIDYKRKLLKQNNHECLEDCLLSDDTSTEKILISKENREELLKAINDLKEEDREMFIRRYFLYEDVESIAQIFKVDRNVVDQRLSRGRKLLRTKLMVLKGEVAL